MHSIKFRLIEDGKVVGYERHIVCTGTISIQHQKVGEDIWHFIYPDFKYWISHNHKDRFTGLYDKKRTKEYPEGQEICEGDIVRLFYGIPPTHDTLVIEYADDENVADISVSGWWMRNKRKNGCSSSLCKTYENDLEVIGTVYENPELLK